MLDDHGQFWPKQNNDSNKQKGDFSPGRECKKGIWTEKVFHRDEELNV